MADNDNNDGGGGGPFCILRHGRKSHTWGELRQATQHTVRDPAVSWLGDNIDPARSHLNEVLVGTGDVVEAVRHARTVQGEIRRLVTMTDDELYAFAKEIQAPIELVRQTKELGRLPVVNFAAGGVATPADAALMMQLGMDGVFVGSGIFKSGDPAKRARAIVQAVTHYNNPKILAEVSEDLGEAMVGINVSSIPKDQHLATRGW